MKIRFQALKLALPFLGVILGGAVIFWSFYRSEEYRTQTNVVFAQTYEVLWRASQIRETAANIAAIMATPEAHNRQEVRLQRDLQILRFNISALRSLVYFDKFFGPADAKNLDRAQSVLSGEIIPALKTRPVDSAVVDQFQDIRNSMYDATGTAISNSRDLSETADIEDGARSNFLMFALFFALLIFGASVGLIFLTSQRRHSEFLKSFSSLHVHATRSRLEALRLFIRRVIGGDETSRSMMEAAERAADELSAINESLLHIAATMKPRERVPLWSVLQLLADAHPGFVRQEIADDASKASVASPHMFMVLDELVENARRALEAAGRAGSPVIVRARLATDFRLRKALAIEVVDDGVGMSPEVQAEALDPFFSTRAGRHVGLGLTGCDEMIRALGGTLRILSTEGQGTTVKVSYPMQNPHMRQELVNETAS